MKRVTLITGHYGSGKTEFSMNLTVDLKEKNDKVAIIDLDIANPYFRSRERQKQLQELGVTIEFNSFGYDITEDLPALAATIKTPLENKDYTVVVDVGGDDSGARVLNQFGKYFGKDDSEMLFVCNANRPETDTLEGAIHHLRSIEIETGIKMDGIISNTHMLKETTAKDIIKGYRLCQKLSEETGIPIKWTTCRENLLDQLKEELVNENITDMVIYPIRLFMRPSWLEL
ncbi:MAG: ATP-binding protein [Anaerovoracaceae bacterium]